MGKGISTTDDLLSDLSFRNWAEGTATKQEADLWDEWCRKSEANRRLAAKAQAELVGIEPLLCDQADSADEWVKLYGHIKKIQHITLHSHRKTLPLMWGYRVAVVIVVIAITTFLTMQWQEHKIASEQSEIVWQEVSTANGQQKKITLTDGSIITLGANSSIVYSDGWVQNSEVEINLQGEAYFDIPPKKNTDTSAPSFKVKTSDGTVLVTGTRFVVDADETRTRVILDEGSVDIERNLPGDNAEKEIISLHTDQLAEFNRHMLSIKRVNPKVYTSWTRQELVLDSTPLSFLTEKISRTYGVNVKVEDNSLYNRKLTGTINFRSMERLLQAVSKVLQIEVIQEGDEVIFNGTIK